MKTNASSFDELTPLQQTPSMEYVIKGPDSHTDYYSTTSPPIEESSIAQSNSILEPVIQFLKELITFNYGGHKKYDRVVSRGGPFHQCIGKVNVKRKIRRKEWTAIYSTDWFHSIVDLPTYKCVAILLLTYTSFVSVFAIIYYLISSFWSCNLGINNYLESFIFTLETTATIGYSTKDIFFNDCFSVTITLVILVLIKIILDASIIGIIYSRISRPNVRASTVILSNKAVLRRVKGKLYLFFKVCELRKHQIVEARVRVYTISHESGKEERDTNFFQTRPLNLTYPKNGMLLLFLPQLVAIELDDNSALVPRPNYKRKYQIDSSEECINSLNIINNYNLEEIDCDMPVSAAFKDSITYPKSSLTEAHHNERKREISDYLESSETEILVVIEGNDAATGGVVQVRHSYSYKHSEIVWDHFFEKCVFKDSDGSALIDFDLFHIISESPIDSPVETPF